MIDRIPKLLIQILQNRFELLSLELQEEKIRFIRLFLMTAIATTFGLVGFLGLGILIVWLLPPDNRMWGAIILIAVILLVSLVSALLVIRMARRHTPFETTIATLRRDVQES
jgi:uncharacterized membrane protein YqjE